MLFYGLLAGAGYGIAQIEPTRLWQVGKIVARAETLEAIGAALALKNAVEHPEIWYATHDVECTPILWPKDRLHALGQLIEEKRHEETLWGKPPPETFTQSALWGLKRVRDAFARKFSGASWQLKQIQKATTPVISNPGDIKIAAEYYRDHPTFINFAISTYSNVTDFFNRRRFRSEHENDYMIYLNAEHYENNDLEWVRLPKGLEREIYAEMKNLPKLEAPPTQSLFSRITSTIISPLTFFKKMANDYKVLSARREAKKMLIDDIAFPGFHLLMNQDLNKAKLLPETAINELAKILLDKKTNISEQISELKRTILNYAEELELQNSKNYLLSNLEIAFSDSSSLMNQISTLEVELLEKLELIEKTKENIEHENELGRWALTALEVAHKKLGTTPETAENIKSNTIPQYNKQLEDSIHARNELLAQLKGFKSEKSKILSELNNLKVLLRRNEDRCSSEVIEEHRNKLKACNSIVSQYLKETIQSAPSIKDLDNQNIDILLKCVLHPNFVNLPKSARDVLFFHILENKNHLNDYYRDYLIPILDLAKPGINIKTKKDDAETELFSQKDKWFGELFKMSDVKSFTNKLEAIKRIISSKLEDEVRKELNLQTNSFWLSEVKKLNLFDIPDLDEHQKLFNDRILEHDVLRNIIKKLEQALYETASISKETKESIPKLIEENTKEFFQTLQSAQTKLKEEKGDELALLSESFRKIYEYWATSLMIDSDPKTSKDELKKMEAEIDRQALRFKLYAVRQLLFPFVEQDPKFQILPDIYKARLLDSVICADSLDKLVLEWKLVPQKLDILNKLSQHKDIKRLPLNELKMLIDKISLSKSDLELREHYKQIQIVIKNIGKIQDHPKFNGISKDQESVFYQTLINAPISDQRHTIESILNTMSEFGKEWGNWLRSWGSTSVQVAQAISETSKLIMGFENTDPTPNQNGLYDSFTPTPKLQLSENKVVEEISTLLRKDTLAKDELLGTLETLLQKKLQKSPELESPIETPDLMTTVRQALSKTLKSTPDKPENEKAPDPNSPSSPTPNKKSGG